MNNPVVMAFAVLAWSSFACMQAASNHVRVAAGWAGGVGVYNPLTGQELLRYSFPESFNGANPNVPQYVSFLQPDFNDLLMSINRHRFVVYQKGDKKILSDPKTESLQTANLIVKSENSYDILSADRAGYVTSYDAASGKQQERQFDFSDHQGVASLSLYSQGDDLFLVTGTTSGFIDIYHYRTGKLVQSINCYEDGIRAGAWINTVLAFNDGKSIKVIACTSVNHGQIGCWDAFTGKKIYVVDCCDQVDRNQPNSGDVYNLNLFKDIDGSLKLVTSAKDSARVIKIWDPLTGVVVQTLYDEQFNDTYPLPIRAFISNDEQGQVIKLIVGYYNGKLAVWNTRTGLIEATVQQNKDLPLHVSRIVRFITLFESNGQTYCTVGNENGSVYTWMLETLELVVNWSVGERNSVSAIASSQEICVDPTKFQLGFFSSEMGCHVPFFNVDHEIDI